MAYFPIFPIVNRMIRDGNEAANKRAEEQSKKNRDRISWVQQEYLDKKKRKEKET